MKERLIELINESGLSRISHNITEMLQDSIRIKIYKNNESEIRVGESKFGGQPDLPDHISWPFWNEKPLSFIAQINLCRIQDQKLSINLPKTGILYFFYESSEQPWGFDPKDKGSWQVYYFNGPTELLSRREFPDGLTEDGMFPSCSVNFVSEISFPQSESIDVENLQLSEDESDLYWELWEQVFELIISEDESISRIGGHPDMIQGEMQLECQLASNGLYCGDSTGYTDPKRKELEGEASKWKLLLQVDSNEDIGMMWGDEGRLYFWIKEDDLERCNFEDVWLVLQCG